MATALFDTNILIDHLRGIAQARTELGRYPHKAISIITWMEVLAGAPAAAEAGTRAFLDRFAILPLDAAVADRTVQLRKQYRLTLPDAIVWASAQVHGMLFVTRDTRGLPADDPGIRMPCVV